jgi:hypothetical protein
MHMLFGLVFILAFVPAVEAPLHCCVWLWTDTVYTTIIYSLSNDVAQQNRQRAGRRI